MRTERTYQYVREHFCLTAKRCLAEFCDPLPRRGRSRTISNSAFSLYEVLIYLTVSVLLMTSMSAWFVGLYGRFERIEQQQEDHSMFSVLTRTLEQDVHSSLRAGMSFQHLQLDRINGSPLIYYVNGRHQLIRYQVNNGGLAVIADRVKLLTVLINGGYVEFRIVMTDGSQATLGAFVGGEQT